MKRISNKKWKDLNPNCIPDWPLHVAVAHFRLFTGHDCLTAYFISSSWFLISYCSICRGQFVMDGYYILSCSALCGTTITDRYWEARCWTRKWLFYVYVLFLLSLLFHCHTLLSLEIKKHALNVQEGYIFQERISSGILFL